MLRIVARRSALALALVVATTACGNFARSGTPAPIETFDPVDYGADLKFKPRKTGKKGDGRLTIYVLEEGTNRPIEGVNVDYTGPKDGTMVTNVRGKATVKTKPGLYDVNLPPCGRDVLATTAAGASVGVVSGGVAGGQLFTTWEQRYRPTPSVRVSTPPPWKEGKAVSLGVRIEDGCHFTPAPGATLKFYAWRISDNFQFLAQPTLRAGSDGFATVRVSCSARGDGFISIYNRFDPDEQVNLLEATSAPSEGTFYR